MTMAVDVKRLSEVSARVEAARLAAEFGITNRARALLAGCGESEPSKPWFVLTVAPGCENDVEKLLTAAGVECWIPSLEVKTRRRSRMGGARPEEQFKVPVWPGYLFVRVVQTARAWAALLRIEGVEGALPTVEMPAAIPDAIVLKIKLKLEHDPHARQVLENLLKQDDMVTIDDGPFRHFEGVVRALSGHDRLTVEVSIFGRMVPVDLELAQVTKIV